MTAYAVPPVDNIITGKSSYIFGYVKSAKLDL
jgi:hypothetical protein